MHVLEAAGLHRFFHTPTDEVVALKDVSLYVDAGEFVAVVGPSGSGKSTLLACLAGLDDPDGGRVSVVGQTISRRTEADRAALRARHIGIMLQGHNLFDHLTVRGNTKLVARLARSHSADRLADLGIASRADLAPTKLSGGEAARASIAIAIASDPDVVLADEPTAELDGDTESVVVELLRELCREGKAVLVVTHSERVASAADRVLTLDDGELRA